MTTVQGEGEVRGGGVRTGLYLLITRSDKEGREKGRKEGEEAGKGGVQDGEGLIKDGP